MGVWLSSAGQGPPPPRRLPPPGTTATSSATQPASSVALVTWITRYGHDGVHALELLVVWRGQPGWFTRGGPRTSSGGGSGTSFRSTSRYGDIELQLGLDSGAHTADIQGKRVELGASNVILVDNVDIPNGAKVVGLRRVDAEVALLNSGYPDIGAVLMRSTAVVSFLRCDVPMPGSRGSGLPGTPCARVVGKDSGQGRRPLAQHEW